MATTTDKNDTAAAERQELRNLARVWLINETALISDVSPDGRTCLELSKLNAFYDDFVDNYVQGQAGTLRGSAAEAITSMMSRIDFYDIWESNFAHVTIIDNMSGRRHHSQP
jgi:hypothetical protein